MRLQPLALVWSALGVAAVAGLMRPGAVLPEDRPGIRRFRTPGVAADVRLSQTFEMTANGLEAVEFRPVLDGTRVSGTLRLSIVETAAVDVRTVASREVAATELIRDRTYRFSFPPVADSRSRTYRLDLETSETRPVSGIAVWATKGERYPRGALLINRVERWADMTFRAVAPAPPIWRALLLATPLPMGLPRGAIALAAFGLTWAALGVVLRQALLAREGSTDVSSPPSASSSRDAMP